ncbi:MAG TPA: methionine--tRNA ligase [Terriglobia bacterium]|nr:methionine--tRNA ligase [Terriglobia bacterium]
MKTFYLTTPIYYPNARPHVGSAYTTIVCDVIARYKRMCGYDVAFLTGTDEHGEKLQRAAEAAGVSPAEFVADKRELFKRLWQTLGIRDYKFVHTSQNSAHVASVQWMIRQADKAGYIGKRKYEGRYCVSDERYVSDNTEPVDCDICGRPAELISEENYFFKLSAFQDRLLEHYAKHREFVQPDYRMNEVESFVRSGLRDISISRRRLKWGIPWPDDPSQVVYVWYDALTSYLTGIGFQGETRSPDFNKYWMGATGQAEVVHMIGKDILRFHAVYWPAFLLAAGLPLPKTVFAHGWIYYEEDKMSKSKGNVVYPEPIIEALDSFGAPGNDALRYYLLREATFGQDTSFSYEKLIDRYNSDLANGLGNLVSRTVAMLHQFSKGRIPSSTQGQAGTRQLGFALLDIFDAFEFSSVLGMVWGLVFEANKLIVESKPWDLAKSSSKEDQDKLRDTLHELAQHLQNITILLYPVMPASAKRIWQQLGEGEGLELERIEGIDGFPQFRPLKPGTPVGKPEPIFPRLDKAKTLAKLHELAEADYDRDKPKEASITVENETDNTRGAEHASSTGVPPVQPTKQDTGKMPVLQTPSTSVPAPGTLQITIDDFAKVEMRVGEIISAESIPKATKLLKVMVDIGTEVRQVLAGIAEHYQPEQLVGMKVVVVTNLQPRKMRGLESNGMIVAASVGEAGKPVLVTFKEDVPKGAKLK